MRVKEHIEANGYSFAHYINASTAQMEDLGITSQRMQVRNESRQATDLGSQQVGAEQNSGRGFFA
jgi:hypothetical protein